MRGPLQRSAPVRGTERNTVKIAGLLVMPSGFFLVLAALVMFTDSASQAAFVFCGLAVVAVGLGVAVRGHMLTRGEGRL